MSRLAILASVAACAPVLWAASSPAPWDAPFASDNRAISEAARKVDRPGSLGVVLLLEDDQFLTHKDGRVEETSRVVYRVDRQQSAEAFSSVNRPYQPWFQEKPELRARVITPDGTVHWLDVKTISDSPVRQIDANIYSDAHLIRAPLPSMSAGAVIEYEFRVRDKTPLLEAGIARTIVIVDVVPTERFHVVICAETGILLRTAARLIPDSAIHTETGRDGTRVECELGPLPTRKRGEPNLPYDESPLPALSFSTGESWQKVAARIAARMHKQVRYTALELNPAPRLRRLQGQSVSSGRDAAGGWAEGGCRAAGRRRRRRLGPRPAGHGRVQSRHRIR